MKTLLFLPLLTVLFTMNSIAQEEYVKKIRQTYLEFNKKIEIAENEDDSYLPAPFKIKTVQVRPALGPVNIEIAYYYEEQTNSTDEDQMELRNTTATLRKVIYTESMPSYTDCRELFFDTNGSLIFYYSKLTGNTCGEKRVYFNLGKMVKIKFNPLGLAECPDENDSYKLPDFTRYPGNYTKDDLDWEKWVLKYAGNHKKAFSGLFESLQ